MKALSMGMLLVAGATFALAGSICPAGTGSNPFPHSPDNAATGCNVVITIAANGSASTAVVDTTAYEESEDVLIGVKNNSPNSLSSLSLSGNDIFGLDGDGICIYTFVGSGYCTSAQIAGTDPQDYYGPNNTFVITDANTGVVNFNPAVSGNGGSAYFSLEGIPTANLTVGVGLGAPSSPGATPAPSSLILLGVGLAFLAAWRFAPRMNLRNKA